jgi:SWI/SNF-related matrix-associated actin-dependent regulator 1 of chromatin subfamily A
MKTAKLAHYRDGTPGIIIRFPFDPEDIAIVKRIPGRKYHANEKVWSCPVSKKAVHTLESAGFLISKKLRQQLRQLTVPEIIDIPGLKQPLFPYQAAGVGFVQSRKGRALIADEMGLGKTIQATAWLQLNPDLRPAVIVCPASVKLNWMREILAWMDVDHDSVELVSGTTPYILSGEFPIINYDILDSWIPDLIKLKPQVVIADEVQYVKSNKAKRTKALRKLVKRTPHFIALSGTPIVNRPIELYNAIRLINPELFPNWLEFTQRYCNRHHNGFGWDISGASNTKELHEILTDSIMIRRTKAQVLTDLPPKIRSFFPLQMSIEGETNYWEAENNFLRWLEQNKNKKAAERASQAETITKIEVLKQIAVSAKMDAAINWITDFLESGEKLVVFATHKFAISALMEAFGKIAVKIDGSVSSAAKRQEAVDKFQGDPKTKLFVGQIEAAGVGINLTAASNVAFLELPWTPGALSQAEDRCHRIKQKNAVNIYYLLAENTIEEKIAGMLDDKRRVLDSVLDGVQTDEKSLIVELIQNF